MNKRVGLLLVLLVTLMPIGAFYNAHAEEDLQTVVPALLSSRCVQCHGPGEAEAGLRLDGREHAIQELESGAYAIVPKQPTASEVLSRIKDDENPMPPEGERLTPAEIRLVEGWIEQGAIWEPHWAYRELSKPDLPKVANEELASWKKNPIDAFVVHKLQVLGMQPSVEADRRTILKRLYYDLIGLPPSPEQMQVFLEDKSTDAYEKVVDQLLASPHYGERWARHWMDVVHYADTHGFEHDIYRDSWPYRDYLIKSLNKDIPYSRFVEEQVAGDVLFPEDPNAIVATGFLATGPWDLSALQAGNVDSIDYQISQYLDRDDIVSTVMSTFVSSTVECARCHDHKFDPISQAEYYNLQAVFSGIDKAPREYDSDPEVMRRRIELTARLNEIETKRKNENPYLLEPSVQVAAASWVESLPTWTTLEPHTFSSAEGTTLEKQPKGSLFATGAKPEVDTYTIQAVAPLNQVYAVRLELLADERLPSGGPGRQDNGNLHLNEISIQAAPRSNPDAIKDLTLKSAHADFNQKDWEVEKSIDGNSSTAWGIHPEVGKSHSAVYLLEEPLSGDEEYELTFKLEQTHGRHHTIGHFRLAAIESYKPKSVEVDASLHDIVAIQNNLRTQEQKIKLAAAYLKWPLQQELDSLPAQQKIYCGTNQFQGDRGLQPAKSPRPIHILGRGSIYSPGELAVPGTLSCVPKMDSTFHLVNSDDEGQRRVALAHWLSSRDNVLTWRSIVNRVWHFHFGRGLVATPSDFGRMGAIPTHPELLDWLAVALQEHGGSLKWLHRQIVTSKTYRQASDYHANYAKQDADNRYLWRMNRRSLDAESIRDSLLSFSDKLDTKMGGPPVKHFVETRAFGLRKEADYGAFDVDSKDYFRRSIYRYIFRTMPDPFMNAMDCPDASQRAPVRNNSITALQAAAMQNDPFLVRQCEYIAERIERVQSKLPDQVDYMVQLIYGRPPEPKEVEMLVDYTTQHGLANACRVLLNSNEFLFVD